MCRYLFPAILISLFPFCSAWASPIIIEDSYIGGGATDSAWADSDVIGDRESFDVSKMEVDIEGSILTLSIYSTYFDNVGLYDTVLGDLFISTDGYTPFGEAPHLEDGAANGEDWELALVLDRHGGDIADADGVQNFLGESGVASLYEVNDENIALSDVPEGIFREGQEVQYHAGDQTALALGGWSIEDLAGTDYDKLTFVIDLGAFAPAGGTTLGFHWNMTCGNDTIEGAYQTPTDVVPEPASGILLLISLLPGLRRRLRH